MPARCGEQRALCMPRRLRVLRPRSISDTGWGGPSGPPPDASARESRGAGGLAGELLPVTPSMDERLRRPPPQPRIDHVRSEVGPRHRPEAPAIIGRRRARLHVGNPRPGELVSKHGRRPAKHAQRRIALSVHVGSEQVGQVGNGHGPVGNDEALGGSAVGGTLATSAIASPHTPATHRSSAASIERTSSSPHCTKSASSSSGRGASLESGTTRGYVSNRRAKGLHRQRGRDPRVGGHQTDAPPSGNTVVRCTGSPRA